MESKPTVKRQILISQPEPENSRSQYFTIAQKYNVDLHFHPFIDVEGSTVKEVRKQRVNLNEFSAVIFTSRNAMDHYFRLCEEMRITISQETKYFCVSEAIALYLQKYIQYRKRKVFYGNGGMVEFDALLKKHKNTGKFLLPCISIKTAHIPDFLAANGFDYQEAILYKTVAADLSELKAKDFDMLVFFSPSGLESLYENFPKFQQKETIIATFGPNTTAKAEEYGLTVHVKAPEGEFKSMQDAMINFLKINKW